ncbi:hypothetical protein OB953_00180 [Aeromonas salmonicida]|uniref:hypothetical protein n=1 Tax=Aeromonas salmonicida TaxID=645 RepID=UPI00259E6ABF|nr:hypothetical protein [Aeromonas salmonicida]MDM5134029.1 hypothetical protein [Aeromonas salmonicida]
MKQHTNEPWHAAEIARDSDTFVKICHANGGTIAKLWIDVDDSDFSDGQRADARRIVACVNALRGVPTEELERHHLAHAGEVRFRIEMTRQRDELLAALEGMLQWVAYAPPHDLSYLDRAHAAIAKAKGGTA